MAHLVGGAIGSLLVYCVPWGLVYVWLLDHSMGDFMGTGFRTMFFGNGVVWGSIFMGDLPLHLHADFQLTVL